MAKQIRDYEQEQQAWKGLNQEVKRKTIEMTQNFAVIDGKAYDTETGEDITGKIHVEPVITSKKAEGIHVRGNLRDHQKENGGYVFVFFNAMQAVGDRLPSLTQSDLARVMYIGTYISYNEGEAGHCYLRHDNGVQINKKALGELLGMSRNRYAEFYRKIVDEHVIAESPEGLAVNPTMFYRGGNVDYYKGDYQYTRLFRKTARELYGQFSGRSIKKLGVVYSILPYVNFNTNIICDNPQQVQDDKLQALKIKELAVKLRYEDDKYLARTMREIKYNGAPVFKFVDDGKDRRSAYIIVNPDVVYAGNGKSLAGIKVLFR